jgi:hypothetical protein
VLAELRANRHCFEQACIEFENLVYENARNCQSLCKRELRKMQAHKTHCKSGFFGIPYNAHNFRLIVPVFQIA